LLHTCLLVVYDQASWFQEPRGVLSGPSEIAHDYFSCIESGDNVCCLLRLLHIERLLLSLRASPAGRAIARMNGILLGAVCLLLRPSA
jgi:ABC-type nitrate/sulfonate/bicarbonate transport system permease component